MVGFTTPEQRALLSKLRTTQNKEWADRTADERFRAACHLRAAVIEIEGGLEAADSDEPPSLWLSIVARRRRIAARSTGP